MALTYVLDTNILLYHLGGRLASPLPSGSLLISVVSDIEVLSYPSLSPAEEAAIQAFLPTVTIIDLTLAVKQEAIALRKAHRLRLPDSIAAATAVVMNARLLTNDANLAKVSSVNTAGIALR